MGIRFSKSIKLGNLVKLNISKSGISATVGKKGASLNIGGKGAYINLSPSAVGLSGTGVSYRKKLFSGGSLLNQITGKIKGNKEETVEEVKNNKEEVIETNIIEEYEDKQETTFNLHKYADNVLSKEAFNAKLNELESEASKTVYQLSIDGDEDTIESMIGTFVSNLDLTYEAKVNYELEGNTLFVDLDLPEIEDLSDEYPCVNKNEVVMKKKTSTTLKEEYARLVMSIGVFMSANFFNASSYIETIVMSAFTSKRNNAGDLKDEYLYSVKFTRDEFVKTDLSKVDNLYEFILKFENRINFNTNANSFKAITPYEMASVEKANSLIDDAIAGLKELGYKNADINNIIPQLNELKLETSGDYLKEALRLLAASK